MKDPLESIEFYNACQSYRIAPMTDQSRVVRKYEELKELIAEKTKYKEMYEALKGISSIKELLCYPLDVPFEHVDEAKVVSEALNNIESLIKEIES